MTCLPKAFVSHDAVFQTHSVVHGNHVPRLPQEGLSCASAALRCHTSFTFTLLGMPLELGLPVALHLPWIWHDKLVPTSRSSQLLFSAWNVLLFWFCTTASFSSMRSQLKCGLEIPSLTISGAAPITPILTPIIVFQILVYCLLAYLSSSLFTAPTRI